MKVGQARMPVYGAATVLGLTEEAARHLPTYDRATDTVVVCWNASGARLTHLWLDEAAGPEGDRHGRQEPAGRRLWRFLTCSHRPTRRDEARDTTTCRCRTVEVPDELRRRKPGYWEEYVS